MSNIDTITPISVVEIDGVEVPLVGGGSNLDIKPLQDAVADYSSALKPYSGIVLKTLADNSWSTIAFVSEEIVKNKYTEQQIYDMYGWSIGDQKSFETISGEYCVATIIDFLHDEDLDSNKTGITFEFEYLLASKYNLNNTSTNVGGWANCPFRNNTLPTIFDTLPEELQSSIKYVQKKFANGDKNNATGIEYSTDRLFIPSAIEIGLSVDTSKVYDYYGEGTEYTAYSRGRSRIKYQYADLATPVAWITRTPMLGFLSSHSWTQVKTNGTSNYVGSTSSQGILLMFCI